MHIPGDLSGLGVPFQLTAQNVKSWLLGSGESVDTHIVVVWYKEDRKTREFYQLSFWLLCLPLYKIMKTS